MQGGGRLVTALVASRATKRWIAAIVAVLIGAPLIGVSPPTAAQSPPSTPPDPVRVRIVDVPGTPAAFALQPSTAVLVPGQTVVVENASSTTQEVEADDGSFDSGPIEPGGAFVAAIDDTGTIPFATIGAPSATGRLVFGLSGLPGAASANARSAVPDLSRRPPTRPTSARTPTTATPPHGPSSCCYPPPRPRSAR